MIAPTLNVTVTGQGRPILLLHGIGRSLRDWDEQHALLSDRYQVWSLDLPGFGHSPPLRGRHTLDAMAEAIVDLVRAEQLPPLHVVGNSLGGGVAMQLSVIAPDLVRSLVLVGSVGFGREVTPALRVLSIPGLGELLMRPSPATARRVERTLFHDGRFATPERVDRACEMARMQPHRSRVYLGAARSLGNARGVKSRWRRQLLRAMSEDAIPTLVVWGDDDRIFPPAHLQAAARSLPHARTRLFPETGHLPQIERAAAFADAVTEFWADVDVATPDHRTIG